MVKYKREICSDILEELLQHFTQEEIAVRVGVTSMTIYNWKKGKKAPPMLTLRFLEKLLRETKK